jgi:hypothetical protein
MRKISTVLAAVATLATAAVAVPSDAQAQWRGHGWGWGGPAVAAGVFGGLAAGAIVGSAFAPYYYGGYAPAYGYSPVYAGSACYIRRERVCDPYRGCWVQRVQVC